MADNKKTKEDDIKKTNGTDEKDTKKVQKKEQELSEEDKQLVEDLNALVLRLTESDESLYKPSLELMRVHIRSSTTSMTSVPKPLKFLRPHYAVLKDVYEKITDVSTKKFCADVISVLAMTNTEGRDCLKFRMLGSYEEIGSWGHEYVRHLSGELSQEWEEKEKVALEVDGMRDETLFRKLLDLVMHIVPYLMAHNAEAEACDLLMDISQLDLLEQFTDESVQARVCLYLKSCVPYDPESNKILTTALNIYRKFHKHAEALLCAIQLGNKDLMTEIIQNCPDALERKQLAYILATHQVVLPLGDCGLDDADDLVEIASNSHLNANFLNLGRDLDILDPKIPDDIYKSHLEPNRPSVGAANVDSAKQNLAASFVNGFVNAAFGQDKLLHEDGNKWLYRNKEHGMMSATATLGLIQLWDIDGGLSQIDKYLYTNDEYIKAGALLACGIVNCGVRNECDPALALLSDYVVKGEAITRIGCIVGIGLAYAGSNRDDVLDHLIAALTDPNSTPEILGMAALACGMVAVGTGNAKVVSAILTCLVEKSEADLKDTFAKFLALGLGLTYLGKQDDIDDTTVTALEVLPDPYKSMAQTLLEICGYAATGNVLKVQKMLHICSEHYDTKDQENNDKKDDKTKKKETTLDLSIQQAVAVLGIGLVAMGEDIGSEMSLRTFGHLLRYGEPAIRRTVPLALALMWTSNPRMQILETLSKFSHDADNEVACNSILAMGIVGAGTNNARLATLLRQLATYHAKDANALFCVRIAQGITHLGKGTLTLCPFLSDRQVTSPVAIAGLLAVLVACLDVKATILSKSHYILFHLVAAIHPRMLITFNEDLKPLNVSVRVGQAVDVVGQAGKPKTITGFQTHTTPVLLAYGERAELATDEYISLSPIMEGFVIVKKNPNYDV